MYWVFYCFRKSLCYTTTQQFCCLHFCVNKGTAGTPSIRPHLTLFLLSPRATAEDQNKLTANTRQQTMVMRWVNWCCPTLWWTGGNFGCVTNFLTWGSWPVGSHWANQGSWAETADVHWFLMCPCWISSRNTSWFLELRTPHTVRSPVTAREFKGFILKHFQ